MVSRVAFLEVSPDRVDDVQQVVRDIVDAGPRGEDGYVGYLVLGDRGSGRIIGITLWESEGPGRQATRRLPFCGPRSSRPPVGRYEQSRSTRSCTTCGASSRAGRPSPVAY